MNVRFLGLPIFLCKEEGLAQIVGGFGRLEDGRFRLFPAGDVTAAEALLWVTNPSSVPPVVCFAMGFEDFVVRVEVLPELFAATRRRTDQLGRPLAHRKIEDDSFAGEEGVISRCS